MSITTCQKVTLISCSVLCVSLFLPRMLLPRAEKELGRPQVGPGFSPPGMREMSLSDDPKQWGVEPFHSMTRSAEASAKVRSIGRGKKHNLMAQVIPIYGFGVLLYILYIIYKLTSKDKNTRSGNDSPTMSMERNMTDDELARLQERILQSERIMERIVSGKTRASGSGRRRRSKSTPTKKEEKLLKQLRQIAQLMQEGREEGASPEMEAEEVPYSADWEGYPEETYPEYEVPNYKHEFDRVALEEPANQPTAEALAERMEQEEEEVVARKLSIVQEEDEDEEQEDEDVGDVEEVDEEEGEYNEEIAEEEEEEEEEAEAEKRLLLLPLASQDATNTKHERLGLQIHNELQGHHKEGRKHISFNDQRDVFHYPKEDTYEGQVQKGEEGEEDEEEDVNEDDGTEVEEEEEEVDEEDPVTEAERLQFSSAECPNPEEEAEEEEEAAYLATLASAESDSKVHVDIGKEVSGLRMRNRRET
ncbi:protein RIC-3 isoform X2 [Phyllopteryx taeniolatus]|uniref:protein RIC-3 isoform X2 n=1 Tax=Phyllopteryx taeniolatus TaxID=161469 RepID=UPI002AD1E292|nr:protein RIC-3 isoform X2 [Phyllopteryx taeniolatus]